MENILELAVLMVNNFNLFMILDAERREAFELEYIHLYS